MGVRLIGVRLIGVRLMTSGLTGVVLINFLDMLIGLFGKMIRGYCANSSGALLASEVLQTPIIIVEQTASKKITFLIREIITFLLNNSY